MAYWVLTSERVSVPIANSAARLTPRSKRRLCSDPISYLPGGPSGAHEYLIRIRSMHSDLLSSLNSEA